MEPNDEEIAKRLQKEFDEEYKKDVESEKETNKFPEEIGEIVIQLLDDLWNNRNFKVIDDSFAFDCISLSPFGQFVGKNEFKNRVVLPMFNAFPDLKYVSHEVFQEGRRIVNRWTFTGTHSGSEYAGFLPHGNKMSYSGVTITRFGEEGTIAETNTFFDRLSLFEQLKKVEQK